MLYSREKESNNGRNSIKKRLLAVGEVRNKYDVMSPSDVEDVKFKYSRMVLNRNLHGLCQATLALSDVGPVSDGSVVSNVLTGTIDLSFYSSGLALSSSHETLLAIKPHAAATKYLIILTSYSHKQHVLYYHHV